MLQSTGNEAVKATFRSRLRARLSSIIGGHRGAIDLASILVGVVVAGALSAGVAAIVIHTVPWAQDESAKQSLGLVTVAQSSANTKYDSFLGGDELVSTEMINNTTGVSIRTNAGGTCYVAFATSTSSTVFYATSTNTTPQVYEAGVTNTDWCVPVSDVVAAPSSTAPAITLTTLPDAHVATDYFKKVTASGLAPITFTVSSGVLPTGLSLDSSTGAITGTPFYEGVSSISIRASNAKGSSPAQALTLKVTSVPTLTTVSLPNGKVGSAYTATLTAAGYPQSYTFEAIGALPAGLSLNTATGVINGTPTVTGDFTATFTVSNSPGAKSDPSNYPLTIGATPVVSTKVVPGAKLGSAYTTTLEATGHKGPYTFAVASGALPAGLTLAGATGVISGTPTAVGPFTFGVTATSSFGTSAIKPLSVTVYTAPAITTASLPNGMRTVAYSQPVVASGSTAPTFSVTVGAVPAGLTLNAAGLLSGTPTMTGSSTFTVRATNPAGYDERSFTVVIDSDITPITSVTVVRSTTTGTVYSGAREASTVTVGGAACSGLTTTLSVSWSPATPTGQSSSSATIAAAARTGATTSHEVPAVANGAKGTMLVSAKCSSWDAPITQSVAYNQAVPTPVVTVVQGGTAEAHDVSWTAVSSLPATFTVARSVPNAYAPSQLTTTTAALTYASSQAAGAVYGYTSTFQITATLNGYAPVGTGTISNAWPASPAAQNFTYTRTGAGGFQNGNMSWNFAGACPAGTTLYAQYRDVAWAPNSASTGITWVDANVTAYIANYAAMTGWSRGGTAREGHPYIIGAKVQCDSNLTPSVSAITDATSGYIFTPQATPAAPQWNPYSYITGGTGATDGYEVCRGHGGSICSLEGRRDELRLDMRTFCPAGNVVANTYLVSNGWVAPVSVYTYSFGAGDGWELSNGVAGSTPWYGNARYTCNTPWVQSATSPEMPSFGYYVRDRG